VFNIKLVLVGEFVRMAKIENGKKNVGKHSNKIVEKKNGKEKEKDQQFSKMQLAAKKAWETRRKNKEAGQTVSEKKTAKKSGNGKVADAKAVVANVVEKKELAELNGNELDKIAKDTMKKINKRNAMEAAKNGNGKTEVRSVDVGKVPRKTKIERHSGGVKLS
jgi:hypothetical protein